MLKRERRNREEEETAALRCRRGKVRNAEAHEAKKLEGKKRRIPGARLETRILGLKTKSPEREEKKCSLGNFVNREVY